MPLTLGYHASHEQFPPSELLRLAQKADAAGFNGSLASDHYFPWTEKQGQSGFVWSWLGAALATTKLPKMGMVNAPGQRYHPAIIAQALGTLEEMFPGRVFACLGSGQNLNEHITGGHWPTKSERNERLRECVDIIRALLRGATVTYRGHVVVEEAKLYTRPATPPPLFGAAITAETAEWVGSWADGLITIAQPREDLRKVVEGFRRGGGEKKPMFLKVQVSFDKTDEAARQGAFEQWAGNIFASQVIADLRLPSQFSALADLVKPDELDPYVRISADPARHAAWLHEDVEMGFTGLFVHNVNRSQDAYIDAFGAKVLPQLLR